MKLEEAIRNNRIVINGELSYLGRKRDETYDRFNQRFGIDHWLIGWQISGIESKERALQLYEDAYYEFLKNNPATRTWLVNSASEVYDIHHSNINSGLDYSIQECNASHLQDIAIRRALTRLQLDEQGITYDRNNLPLINIFRGDHLIQIRGKDSEGFSLNPGQVPFHLPELIVGEHSSSVWWGESSIEDFYQRNKVLVVDPERLHLCLAIKGKEDCYFMYDDKTYYHLDLKHPERLQFTKGREARAKVSGVKQDNYRFVKPNQPRPYNLLVKELSL